MGFRLAARVLRGPRRGGAAGHGRRGGRGVWILRYHQLAVQNGLLLFGIFQLRLEVSAVRIAAVVGVGTAVLLQWIFTRCYRLAPNLPSALNTGLSVAVACRRAVLAALCRRHRDCR